jgi:CRP/FNR family transcriptional regulator, cyclic AMP receptor protein
VEIDFLRNISLFAGFAADEIREIFENSKKRAYPSGSIVVYQGDPGEVIYLILKGKVKVVLTHPKGKEIILNTLDSGDYFGEMSVFDRMPRSATVVAMEACRFLIITREAITALVRKDPRIAIKMLLVMSERIRAANEQISSLAHLDVRGRVARMLIHLFKKSDRTTREGYPMIPRPSMKDMANMIGASRETVSRVLTDLSKRGLIRITRDRIVLVGELGDEKTV